MRQELERLKKELANKTPGTQEYNDILGEIEKVNRIVRQDELDADKRVSEQHHMELEEKKFQHEQAKFETQIESDARKEAFDKERFEFEQKKFEFEQEKFQQQTKIDEEKIELDKERLQFDAETSEYQSSTRYTTRQIVRRCIELGAETACTGFLVSLIGNFEQTSILSKTAMMFVRKR